MNRQCPAIHPLEKKKKEKRKKKRKKKKRKEKIFFQILPFCEPETQKEESDFFFLFCSHTAAEPLTSSTHVKPSSLFSHSYAG